GAVGADLAGGQEGYHFLWQKIRGDFIFEAKVEMDIDPLRPDGKAMLMCRNELPTRAPFLALVCAAYTPEGRLNVKFRTQQNANVSDVFQPWIEQLGNPCHLRIKRAKGVFEFFYRNPGETGWTPLHTFLDTEAVFAQDLYVGVAVTSPIGASLRPLQEATFSDITLKKLNGTVILLR
ncbi:MAG: hypothetical protein FWH21_09775, partial [Kiritimatiellaeota bacterium]|nr:hypothetical protein [Kiritimatiellota bacterium]